jgi:hypothetical protein
MRRIQFVVRGSGQQELLGARAIDLQFQRRIRERRVEDDRMFSAFFGLLPLFLEEERRTCDACAAPRPPAGAAGAAGACANALLPMATTNAVSSN